ncbi:MAG: hypothetical protein JO056_12395 [Alphaproteobacteria bacterium]|nr:hypothetical protein [Alphaproteobacteria bacterium]
MTAFYLAGALTAILLISPALAAHGELDPDSAKALHDYTLSMDRVNAMQAAMDDAKKSAGTAHLQHIGDNSQSVAEMEAKLSADPQAVALFRKHGLSVHDVVVMPFVLMDAGMAAQYPSAAAKLSDRMSPAQVAFYKAHEAELKKQSWLFGQ